MASDTAGAEFGAGRSDARVDATTDRARISDPFPGRARICLIHSGYTEAWGGGFAGFGKKFCPRFARPGAYGSKVMATTKGAKVSLSLIRSSAMISWSGNGLSQAR